MNEFDLISGVLLFYIFPAILGYFLVNNMKLNFSLIFLFSIGLGLIGYFYFGLAYFIAAFLLFGSGIAFLKEGLRNTKKREKEGKNNG